MPINFPLAPANDQTYAYSGSSWIYNSAKGVWSVQPVAQTNAIAASVSAATAVAAQAAAEAAAVAALAAKDLADTITATLAGLDTTANAAAIAAAVSETAAAAYVAAVTSLANSAQTALNDITAIQTAVGITQGLADRGTAQPVSGTYLLGSKRLNNAPTILGTAPNTYVIEGWLCISAGTPGTWVELKVPMNYATPIPGPAPAPAPAPLPTYIPASAPGTVNTWLLADTAPGVAVSSMAVGMHVSVDAPTGVGTGPIAAPNYSYGYLRTLGTAINGNEEICFWNRIELTNGVYTWTDVDDYMANTTGHDVIWVIYGTPVFHQLHTGETSPWPSWAGIASPPSATGLTALAAFVTALLARYPTRIKALEIWNEPTLPWTVGATDYITRWTQALSDAESLSTVFFRGTATDLANIAYKVKTVAGAVPVIGCGFVDQSGATQYSLGRFLNAPVTAAGGSGNGKTHIDGVSIHFYDYNTQPETLITVIDNYKAKMTAAGVGTLPVWLTEVGAEDGGSFTTGDPNALIAILEWAMIALAKGCKCIVYYAHTYQPNTTDTLGNPVSEATVQATLSQAFLLTSKTIRQCAVLSDGRVWVEYINASVVPGQITSNGSVTPVTPTAVYDEPYTVDIGNAVAWQCTCTIVGGKMRVTNTTAAFSNAHIQVLLQGGQTYNIAWDATQGTGGTPVIHVGSPASWNQYAESSTNKALQITVAGTGTQTINIGLTTNSATNGAYNDYDFLTITPTIATPAPAPVPAPIPPPNGGGTAPAGITFLSTNAAITSAYGDMNRGATYFGADSKKGTALIQPACFVGDYADFATACANYPLGAPYYLPVQWNGVLPWFWVKPITGTRNTSNAVVQMGLSSCQIYNIETSAWEYLYFNAGFFGHASGGDSSTGTPRLPDVYRNGMFYADANNQDLECWSKNLVTGAEYVFNRNKALCNRAGAIYVECGARLIKADVNGPDDHLDASIVISGTLGWDVLASQISGASGDLAQKSSGAWGRSAEKMDGGSNANKKITNEWKRWSSFSVAERGGPWYNGKPPPWSGIDGQFSGVWAWDGAKPLTWWQANPPAVIQIPVGWTPT
jgi:hypothetical protein